MQPLSVICVYPLFLAPIYQRILHAIQQADPFYDHVKWAEEAQQNDAYMRNICQMPQALHPMGDEDMDEEGMYIDDPPR